MGLETKRRKSHEKRGGANTKAEQNPVVQVVLESFPVEESGVGWGLKKSNYKIIRMLLGLSLATVCWEKFQEAYNLDSRLMTPHAKNPS